MARQIINPVSAPSLAADHATVMALQSLPDYQPVNPAYSLPQIVQHQVELTQAELEEQLAEEALVRARAKRILASHTYHDAVVGARAQVVAQYGPDATAVALIGLTRKSERKQPAKRKRQPAV